MCDAYGIVNFESANVHVKGMGEYRPVSAFSYLGRYRLVDFPLSNMSNSGIDQIKVLVKSNPRSLVEHLGNGRQYNLNSKRGRLQIIPAISSEGVDVNNTDICAMRSILELLEAMPQEYVIIAPPNMVYRQDWISCCSSIRPAGRISRYCIRMWTMRRARISTVMCCG